MTGVKSFSAATPAALEILVNDYISTLPQGTSVQNITYLVFVLVTATHIAYVETWTE